jgi:hypothetical protein
MDLLRDHGLPVPKILAYSIDPRNTIGAEYVLMDLAQGRPLADVWFGLSYKERVKIFSQIAVIESNCSDSTCQGTGVYPMRKIFLLAWEEHRSSLPVRKRHFASAQTFL